MSFPATQALAPHDPPMLFVDEVLERDSDGIRTRSAVSCSNPLFVPGRGLPGYVLFEIMAQSISIQDGLDRRELNEPPQVGFLLGTRKFVCHRDWLQDGEIVIVVTSALLNEGEMRSFRCKALGESGERLAEADLNVFRPDDPMGFLAKNAGAV